MKKSRFLAFLIALVMVFSGFAKLTYQNEPLISEAQSNNELKGKIVGKKKVFTISKNLVKEARIPSGISKETENASLNKKPINNLSSTSTNETSNTEEPGFSEGSDLTSNKTEANDEELVKEDKSEILGEVNKDQSTPGISTEDSSLSISPEQTSDELVKVKSRQSTDNTEVELITVGINGSPFDWSVFTDETFNVTFSYTDPNTWEEVEIPGTKLGFTSAGIKTLYVDWPDPNEIDPDSLHISVDFDANYDVRAEWSDAGSTPTPGGISFKLIVTEVPNTKLIVNYENIYGKALNEAYKPSQNDSIPNFKINMGEGAEISTPKDDLSVNLRNFDGEDGLLDLVDRGIITEDEAYEIIDVVNLGNGLNNLTSIPITINDETSGEFTTTGGDLEKSYRYEISQPTKKDPATITLTYLPLVAEPPKDESGNLAEIPEGYVRVTFNALDHGSLISNGNKEKIYDVKKNTSWKIAKDNGLKIPETIGDAGYQFEKWDPKLPEDEYILTENKTYKASFTDFCAALVVKESSQEYDIDSDRQFITGKVANLDGSDLNSVPNNLKVAIVDKAGNPIKDRNGENIGEATVNDKGVFEFTLSKNEQEELKLSHQQEIYFSVLCADNTNVVPSDKSKLILDLKGPSIEILEKVYDQPVYKTK